MRPAISRRASVASAVFVILFLISGLVPFQDFLPDEEEAYAQSTRLIVSAAQNAAQDNHFFGPQIVQITIDDANARDPDTSTSGLTVKGISMPRVHLADGMWYAFIAEEDSFLLFLDVATDGRRDGVISVSDADDADNRNTAGPSSIQFGDADSFVREITEVAGGLFVEVRKDAIFPSLPDPFTGAAINPDVDINPSAEPAPAGIDWPYVRLFSLEENDSVDIGHAGASTGLVFGSFSSFIEMELDRGSYPLNSEIVLTFRDFMWNINPVEEDLVRFVLNKATGLPVRILYQPLIDFNPDPATGENFPDLLPILTNLEFDERQVLEVDAPEGLNALKFIEIFDASDQRIVTFAAEPFVREGGNARLISEFATAPLPIFVGAMQVGTSAADDLPVITVTESDPNTSLFKTADARAGGRSNIFAGTNDRVVSPEYFDIVDTGAIGLADASVNADKQTYDSGDRAKVTVTDADLNTIATTSEDLDGIRSKTFVRVGNPFPLANNPLFNTLPRDPAGNFEASSIRGVDFQLGACPGVVERVDFDAGATDFTACGSDIEDLAPLDTELVALDLTTSEIGATPDLPTGFIVNSDVRLADVDAATTFSMTKRELLDGADPFIRAVSSLVPTAGGSFGAAAPDSVITVTFPRFNLVQLDLRNVEASFSRAYVEVAAFDGASEVGTPQMVDFDPFDAEDLDGDAIFEPDPLTRTSGSGSFRVPEMIDSLPPGTDLNGVSLRFSVVVTDGADNPVDLRSGRHQAVIDVAGLGVIRSEGVDKDRIALDAFENFVYRLSLDEEGENTANFGGEVDLMTVLHDDTVQEILNRIVPVGDPIKVWLPNRFVPPNRLAFSYVDTDIAGAVRETSATFSYETRDGVISWDSEQYRFSQVAFLTVEDQDLNRRPDAVEQYTIPQDGFVFFEFDMKRADTSCTAATPNCFAGQVEATLRETGPATGAFRAQITIPQRVLLEDGSVIKTIRSDIEANYIDVRDSSSGVQEFDDVAAIRSDVDPSTLPSPEPPEFPPEEPVVAERGSTKLELNKGNYHPHERVVVTVTAPDENNDRFRSDVIFVNIKKQSTNTGLTNYKLVETGVDTGEFTGHVDLRGDTVRDRGVGPTDGEVAVEAGDSLIISYAGLEASVTVQYNEARVFWNKARYALEEKAALQVMDTDMNKGPERIDVVHLEILVGSTKKMDLELREIDVNAGIFGAELSLVGASSVERQGGEVVVRPGDTITALYNDETVPLSSIEAAGLAGNALPVKAVARVGGVPEVTGVNAIVQTESRLVDADGRMVTSPKSGELYNVESVIENNTEQPYRFAFIVLIRDGEGITQYLEFVTYEIGAGESVTAAVEWRPGNAGKRTIEIFVWQNLEDAPSPISSSREMSVRVE